MRTSITQRSSIIYPEICKVVDSWQSGANLEIVFPEIHNTSYLTLYFWTNVALSWGPTQDAVKFSSSTYQQSFTLVAQSHEFFRDNNKFVLKFGVNLRQNVIGAPYIMAVLESFDSGGASTANPTIINPSNTGTPEMLYQVEDSFTGNIVRSLVTSNAGFYTKWQVPNKDNFSLATYVNNLKQQRVIFGTVNEDDFNSINFWRTYPNYIPDGRYVYLNGGPLDYGWRLNYTTKEFNTSPEGMRLRNFLTNCLKLGMIPYLVYYNIPSQGESFYTNLQNMKSSEYMKAYKEDLLAALNIVKEVINPQNHPSIDVPVKLIMEPDAVAYMMQNQINPDAEMVSNLDGNRQIPYSALIREINNLIINFRETNNVNIQFGWQINLWGVLYSGSKFNPGGKGICRVTDFVDYNIGVNLVNEAATLTHEYYASCGCFDGSDYIVFDKYGLDGGHEYTTSAKDTTWLWNLDHWHNYAMFVKRISDLLYGKEVILWQMTAGYLGESAFTGKALPNIQKYYQDSFVTFLFGDTFKVPDHDYEYFIQNKSNCLDMKFNVMTRTISWPAHVDFLKNICNVSTILIGAGVGISTHNVGGPIAGAEPTEDFFSVKNIQAYISDLSKGISNH